MNDLEQLIRSEGAGALLELAIRKWNAISLLSVVLVYVHEGKDVVLGGAFLPPSAVRMNGAKHSGIPGFRLKGKVSPKCKLAALRQVPQRFPHFRVVSIYRDYLTTRTTGERARALANTHVIVAGCGSLGGQVAVHLAQAGVGKLTLMDDDFLDWRNVGRHVLDGQYVGRSKVSALQQSILRRFPDMSVDVVTRTWEEHFQSEPRPEVFSNADLMISLTGEVASNRMLDSETQIGALPAAIFGWLEPFGVAAHAILSIEGGCGLAGCSDDSGLLRDPVTSRDSHPSLPQEASCGTTYQPYSALSALYGVALVGELAVDALLGRQTVAAHRVWVGSAGEFGQNGLSLSPTWHSRLNQHGYARRFELPIPPA